MYVVVEALMLAGNQVPEIPFVELFDNVDPEQIGVTGVLNVGTLGEFIEIVIVVVLAHCPTCGVNV